MTSGLRSTALFKAAQLLAASARLQEVMADAHGAAETAAGASDHIHLLEASDLLDDSDDMVHPRPRVIVGFGQEFSASRVGEATWNSGGTINVCFEFPPDDLTASKSANLLSFADTIGTIIAECNALAGIGNSGDGESYLNVVEWMAASGPPDFSNAQSENGASYLIDDYSIRWEG